MNLTDFKKRIPTTSKSEDELPVLSAYEISLRTAGSRDSQGRLPLSIQMPKYVRKPDGHLGGVEL